MAEGFANRLHGDKLTAYSAGLEAHGLNDYAVKVMKEAGIDISSHQSQRLDELDVAFDYVVTVCDHAYQHCPAITRNARLIRQNFDDPPRLAEQAKTEAEKVDCYRRVREQIRQFVESLPGILASTADRQPDG